MSEAFQSGEQLVALTADIASAHVSFNKISATDLPALIEKIYGALARLGQPAEPEAEELRPAVSVRSSVKPESITCLECGRKMKVLKRHLSNDHGLTVDEYRQRWDLSQDYPVVAPEYAERRREMAKANGLGRKPSMRGSRRRKGQS